MVLKLSFFGMIPFILLTPLTTYLSGAVLYISLMVIYSVYCMTQNVQYVLTGLLINNSVEKRSLGSANGIAHAVSSLARITGPAMFGAVFEWTTTNGLPYPLNAHLVFILISVV
jgi:hypothetical protein